jgi:chitin synthase
MKRWAEFERERRMRSNLNVGGNNGYWGSTENVVGGSQPLVGHGPYDGYYSDA